MAYLCHKIEIATVGALFFVQRISVRQMIYKQASCLPKCYAVSIFLGMPKVFVPFPPSLCFCLFSYLFFFFFWPKAKDMGHFEDRKFITVALFSSGLFSTQ